MTDNHKLSDVPLGHSSAAFRPSFPSVQIQNIFEQKKTKGTKRGRFDRFGSLVVFATAIVLGLLLSNGAAQEKPVDNGLDDVGMRRVFVPVDDLDALIARDQRGVLLPKDEFLKLYRDAQKNVPVSQKAPVGVVVSGATYTARFDGEQLLVTAEIKLAQLHDSWQAIPLPLAGMSVEQAKLDGQAAKLGRADQNLFLLSDAKGEHTLTLELSAPLNAVGADKLVSLGVLPGIAAKLKVAVPAGKHLQFDELSVERPAAADQPANYELAVGGQRNLVALQLTDRQRERATDSLLFATTGFGLRVAPGEVTWHAVTALQVHGTPLDRLVCVVPKTLEITDVDSNGLEAWELSDNPDDATTTRITLNYRQSFDGARRIDFRGVMAVPAGEVWNVPTLRINQVTSHIGRALIQHDPAVRLRTVESTGVRTATVNEADLKVIGTSGATDAGQVSLLFDVWQEKFTLGFVAQPKEQTVQASIASIFDLTAQGLDLITAATIETSFAPLFEIELSLPAEWLITQVTVNGQPLRWEVQPREPGTNHIRIALPQPLKSGVEAKLQINAHRDPDDWPVEDEPVEVTLPELRLPQSSVTEGTYVIKADADLDVVPGEITGLDPANVAVPGTRLGFAYQDTRFSGTLKVERKPSRVSARTLTFARLDKQTLHTHFEAELDITGGGLRVLEVALPELAGKDLRFQMVNVAGRIVEQTSRAGENGELIWTLRLDRHLVGTATLVVTSVVPRRLGTPARPDAVSNPEDQTGKSARPTEQIPHLRVIQADRQHGYIAIEAEGDQRLSVTAIDANKANLTEVDPIDLPVPSAYAPTQRIVSAFRYFTGTPNLTIADERFDRLPVPTAICREAKITSILSAAGEFQHQARFAFTAVAVQSLRVRFADDSSVERISNPFADSSTMQNAAAKSSGAKSANGLENRSTEERATLWAALIDGRPVEVRRTAEAFLIPLPASDDPTVERQLELFYRTLVPALRGTGELRQPPPELTVLNGAGVSQPMQVLDQQWELRYPQDLLLTDSKGAFIPDAPLRNTNWLTRLPQKLAMPSWWNIQRMVTAMLLLLVIVGLIWSFIRWSFLKGFVAPAVLLVFISAFVLPATQSARNAARKMSPNDLRQREIISRFGANDNADDGDGAGHLFFDLATTGDAPSAGAPPMAMSQSKPLAMEPTVLATEAASEKKTAAKAHSLFADESEKLKERSRQLKSAEMDGPRSSDGESKNDQKMTGIATRFNKLMNEKRYAEAEVLAKQAKELESDNPVAETMVYKSKLARRIAANDKLKDANEQGFWNSLDSVELAGIPMARGNTHDADGLVDAVRALEHGEAGGLLSLTMALEGQADAAVKKFRYLGTETAGSGIGLEIVYENRAAGWTGRWFWIAALAFVAWLVPLTARNVRVLWSILGLTLPLALAPLAPLPWQNTLDGVFFGTLAAIALWTSRCLCDALCCALPRMKTKAFWTRSLSRKTALLIFGATLLGSATSAVAQPPANPAPPANPNPDVPAQPTIVVPYDDPKNPLAAERVFLPQAKFIELWNAAHPEQRVAANAPQEGLVAEALFVVTPLPKKAEAEGPALARVVARLTLFSFRSQQVVLPIPLRLTSLIEAKLDDKPAPIVVRDENGSSRLHVVLDKPGLHVLDLVAEIPIQQAGPAGQLLLLLDPLPSARLLFVPDAEVTFRVNGASNTYRVRKGVLPVERFSKPFEKDGSKTGESKSVKEIGDANGLENRSTEGNEVTYYEVPVNGGGDVRLAWQPKQAIGAVDAIVQAESATAVQVEDAGVRIVSGWQFKVPRGSINDVSFSLPKELRVRSISGADVGGWELNENADGRALRVFLRRAVGDQTALAFELFMEAKIAGEAVSIKVPAFAPLQVTRDFGVVGLFAAPQFALRNIATKGLTQINVDKFVSPVALPGITTVPLNAFRYTARPFEVSFAAGRKAPESTGFAEHALVVERRKVRMSSRLRWELAGALRSSVNVQLPPGWLAVDVDATALEDWHVDPATNLLTVEFTEPRIGAVEVVLQGNVAKEPEDTLAEITLPVPQELSKLVTQTAVWFDPAYQATINASNGWKTSDPEQCSEELRSKLGRSAKFVFMSNALAPELLGFDLVRAVPKLSADAVTLLTVSDTAIDYSLALQWKITEAAADTFTFTTPDWLAGKLDFQGAGIRQTSFKSAGKESGRTRWTVTLQDPVGSRFFLLATATLPPPEKRTVSAPTISFDRRDVIDGDAAAPDAEGSEVEVPHSPLETQRQFVVLINMSGNQVSPVGNVGETVPREELPIVVDQRLVDQAAAVLRVRSTDTSPTRKRVTGEQDAANNQQTAATPTWSLKSFAAQAGAPASVNLADLTTVLAADGTWRMQAIYTIKNRSRQFLALQLPEGSQALSVFVADQPARLVELKREKGKTYQLVAPPKTSEADLSFQVKLVLAGRLATGALPRGLKLWSQDVELPVPTVVSQSDDKEYGIPVARTLWTVHVPQEWSAYPLNDPQRHNLSHQGGDTAEVAYRATWLQEANDLLRVVEGNYNSSQKLQARDNIKQLWSRIDSSSNSSSSASSEEGRKLSEAVQESKGKHADLESRVIIESLDGAATNFYVAKDQQQAAEARAAQQRDKNANGRLFFGQGGQQGGGFQRGIVNLNNNDILTSNSGSGVMNGEDRNGNGILDAGEDANGDGVLNFGDVNDSLLGANVSSPDSGLKFKLNVIAPDSKPPAARKPEVTKSKSSGSRQTAGKGVSEEDRANRRKQSVDQLQDLNRAVDSGKLAQQQQVQQPANQSGDFRNGAPTSQDIPPFGSIVPNAVGDGPRGEQSGRNWSEPSNRQRGQFTTGEADESHGRNWSEPSNRQRGRNGIASGGGQQGGGRGFGGRGQGGLSGGMLSGGRNLPTDLSAHANGPVSGTVAMGENLSLQIQQRQSLDGTVTAAGWSQTGGLSLPIEIQREGNVLRFSRASGTPRLALAVRPNESAKLGLGLMWSVVWAVIAVWLLKAVLGSACSTSWRQVTCGLSVLGLLGMFFLPMPLSELCFVLFALSTIVLAIGVLRSKRQNAAA